MRVAGRRAAGGGQNRLAESGVELALQGHRAAALERDGSEDGAGARHLVPLYQNGPIGKREMDLHVGPIIGQISGP